MGAKAMKAASANLLDAGERPCAGCNVTRDRSPSIMSRTGRPTTPGSVTSATTRRSKPGTANAIDQFQQTWLLANNARWEERDLDRTQPRRKPAPVTLNSGDINQREKVQAALLRPTRKALCNCDEHEEAAKAWRERSELLEEQCRRYATLLAGAQRDMEMLKGENEQLRMSLGMSEKNRMAAIGTANDYMARQQSQQQSYTSQPQQSLPQQTVTTTSETSYGYNVQPQQSYTTTSYQTGDSWSLDAGKTWSLEGSKQDPWLTTAGGRTYEAGHRVQSVSDQPLTAPRQSLGD